MSAAIILVHISSYVGRRVEHWAGTHPGAPSLSGSGFLAFAQFLNTVHVWFQALDLGVPEETLGSPTPHMQQ